MNQCLEVKQQSCNHEYRNNTLSMEKLEKKRSRIPLNHKKEWNFAIWNNMDGLGGHYTKWNKSGRERQILYDITYMWNIKIKQGSTRSSTLAWKLPWTEKPGRLQSMGLLKVGHDWATSLSLFTVMHWRRKWQPTPVFLPGESQGRGSLVGCHLWGRTESDTTEET